MNKIFACAYINVEENLKMSQKKTLNHYFKVISKSSVEGENVCESDDIKNDVQPAVSMKLGSTQKKRSLSLLRTPNKAVKTDNNDVLVQASPVSLPKNDESPVTNTPPSLGNSSNDTIIYSPYEITTTLKKISPNFRPTSRNKIYSPNRKRSIHKRNPNVKRNLANELNTEYSPTPQSSTTDEVLKKACEGMDDKTIFFLNIINKYLTTESLKSLLDKQCQYLLEQCFQVPKQGMRLVCRLFWRKRGWYTCSQLPINKDKNEKINESMLQQVLTSLVQNKFLVKANESDNTMLTFDELTGILKLEDLKKICKDLLKKKPTTKEKIIKELKSFIKVKQNMSNFVTGFKSDNTSRLLKIMRTAAGDCYKLSDITQDTLSKLYLLMYLGIDSSIIRDKKLELMLINYKTSAETSPIPKSMTVDNASVVFSSKDEFYKYITAQEIYEDYLKIKENADRCKIIRQVFSMYKDISVQDMLKYESISQWLHRFTPPYIFIKILDEGVQDLKREKNETDYKLALDILNTCLAQTTFRQHRKSKWYDVKALILQTLKQYDEAAVTLIQGFQSNMSLEEKEFLRKRAEKIATQKNIIVSEHLKLELMTFVQANELLEKNLKGEHIFKQPVERFASNHGKIDFLVKDNGVLTRYTAEEYCIKHYTQITREFTHGEHREGRIITALFFLLFWDIIYCQPPNARGIFLSHYQTYPLDMFTDSFYTNRKKMIDVLLADIEMWSEEELLNTIHAQWELRDVEMLGLHHDEWMSVKAVVLGLAGGKLSAMCARLARSYGYWRSGFPDLTLWNIKNNHIKFVEVKTDADKPSIKQIQWMHYLTKHGIDTAFCYVGTNTMRCKSRAGLQPNADPSESLESSQTMYDELDKYDLDSDSDFEEKKQYTIENNASVNSKDNQCNEQVEAVESNDAFSDDDVIEIPQNYLQIIIDG